MIMSLPAAIEEDVYLGINAGAAISLEIYSRAKGQPVSTGWSILHEIAATPVCIRSA
jgi:hypothetical protein